MKKDTKQAEIAKIHIAKKDLGLDDETYRSVLWTCARVHSSKELDHAGRAAVLDHFKARGWKPVAAKNNVASFKARLVWKIDQLLSEMKLQRAYAEGIAKQMFKREKIEWCSVQELRGIVAALVNKQKANHAKD